MSEIMTSSEFDVMKVMATVSEQPIKLNTEPTNHETLAALGRDITQSLQPYNDTTRGTCMDERGRASLVSGEAATEIRPSAPGGSDVYGLSIAELTGYYDGSSLAAEDRARDIKQRLNAAGVASGGHEGCAADNLFGTWAGAVIADNADVIADYVARKVTEDGVIFDTATMEAIIAQAVEIRDSGRYSAWTEQSYFDILGEESAVAIEKLVPEDHLGIAMAWIDIPGYAMDQTAVGNRAFELNRPYMERIEAIVASGPDAEVLAARAPYARYAVVRALSLALPNQELQELTIRA